MEMCKVLFIVLALPSVFGAGDIHDTAVQKLVIANTQFAVDLYHEIVKQPGVTNVVFSPVSIAAALAMLRLGTAGNSTSEIESVLHLEHIESSLVNSAFRDLNGLLFDKPKSNITLKGASAAFISKKSRVLKDYKNALSMFGAEIDELDFSDPRASVDHINKWISEQTGGFIKDMLDGDAINAATDMMLTNTLYFNGEWHSGFNPEQTEDRAFYVSRSRVVKTPFMHQRGKFKYGYVQPLTLQVLEMPYVGHEISMIVLLPDDFDLKAVEDNLNHANLKDWLETLSFSTVDLAMPKFTIDAAIELQAPLERLGISDIFSSGRADLSGITGDKSLHVDKIFHKGVLEVTEVGSTAAAATTVRIMARSVDFATQFFADQPFLWLLRHNETGQILFLGRFKQPVGEEIGHEEL